MVKVFGHRGTRGEGNPPENSLPAFKSAIEQGAQGIELDLFLTKDNHLVVFHDDNLKRMTGMDADIRTKTLAELKALRLRDTKGNPTEESIPTYKEVFDMIEEARRQPGLSQPERGRLDNFVVNTEIKGTGIAQHVAKEMGERLKNGWSEKNFQVSSFDMESLREMKKSLPSIHRGALFEGPLPKGHAPWDITIEELRQRIAETRDIEPASINITLPSLMANDGAALRMIKEIGARPVAWTCDEKNPLLQGALSPQAKSEAAFLHANEIDIITDFPRERLQALKAVEKSSPFR